MTTHNDSEVDSTQFRRTMGLWPTGVAVLAVQKENGEVKAMTANSITSVSLDPLLVLVCIHKEATIIPHLHKAPILSLSFLRDDQETLSGYFAKLWEGSEPPDYKFIEWAGGVRLESCVGAVGMKEYAIHEVGDHWIVIGEVVALFESPDPTNPLIFFGGNYRQLTGES
ncbi:MAG: flavin reductase family protein [Anaerolineae bacterium]|nr:flavin reductase family protein [Anaerolineae bacterium]